MAEATENQIRAEALLGALWADAEIGGKVRKTAKTMFSDVKIPEETYAPIIEPIVNRATAIEEELKTLKAERLAEKQERDERQQKRKMEDSLDAARKKFRLTDEGFDQMVARMKETGNYTDAEAAAAFVASTAPPAEVKGPTWAPEKLNLYGTNKMNEAMAFLHRDPEGYMDAELSEFMRDPDKYVRETPGVGR